MKEKLIIIVIAVLLTLCVITVVRAAHDHAPVGVRSPKWSPPLIAQCDRDIYTRITEGCDD